VVTALSALVAVCLTGCAPTLSNTASQWSAADSQEETMATETISIAALHCDVPMSWEDVSRSDATEVYPVAYSSTDKGGATSTLRFSPDYHDATTVAEAVSQVSAPDEDAETEHGITGSTTQPGQPYPGAVTARTAEHYFVTEAGTEMVTHWWFLQDEKTGTIYAVEFTGADTDDSVALIETIDSSIRLGDA
jgi:hypothetical protein